MVDRKTLRADYATVKQYAIERLGYTVYEGPNYLDTCCSAEKVITICSRTGIENRLYGLLHECGHALIRENIAKFAKEYRPNYEGGFDGRKARTVEYKVSTVEEEVEAWKRGKRLAIRLGIELDEERFDSHKAECLMTYLKWAVGSGS